MKALKFTLSLLVVLCVAACSSLPKKSASFKLRDYKQLTLENGLTVLFIPSQDLPYISFSAFVLSGSVHEQDKFGLAQLTASMLSESTRKLSSAQFNESVEILGADLGAYATTDYSMLSASGLSLQKEKLFDLYMQALLEPAFAAADFNRKKSELVNNTRRRSDRAGDLVEDIYREQMYKGHAYSRPVKGLAEQINKVRLAEVKTFYKNHYVPANSMVVVTGQFDEKFEDQVKQQLLKWKATAAVKVDPAQYQGQKQSQFSVYTKPQLQQAEIRIGQKAIERNHPDFMPLRLANLAFGGAFATRLNQRIRDDLGLTYSISSGVLTQKWGGDFRVSTFTRFEKVEQMYFEIQQMLKDFIEKGITERELKSAKAVLVGQFPATIETPEQLGFNMALLHMYGVDYSYLQNYIENVNAISLKQVNEALKRNFSMENQIAVILTAPEQLSFVEKLKEKAIQPSISSF